MIQTEKINSVIEPERISFWPLQPGWYLLLGMLLALLIFISIRRYKFWLSQSYKREAIQKIKSLGFDDRFYFKLNKILKSVAIQSFGRETCASLSGEEWLSFLNSSVHPKYFNSEALDILKFTQYKTPAAHTIDFNYERLKNSSINWIKKHK